MTLPPALFKLVALPFERERYVARVQGIVARYEAMLGVVDASPDHRRRRQVELMYTHPSAWSELESIDREEIIRRRELARTELTAVRAAAPLPAPATREERTRVLALADFEWLARHVRTLARRARRFGIAAAIDHHVENAADPIGGLDALVVEALASVPRGARHGALRKLVAVRHQCPPFEHELLGRAKNPTNVDRTVVGRFEDLREGRAKRVEIADQMIAVFKHEGRLRAIEDTCPHRGGPLGKGEIDEHGCVRCPLHGWPFDLTTGRMRGNENLGVKTFESGVDDDGNIWVGSEAT
ncbi:MAG: Rieske 2Fe-2S domain-containing protein [Deltaproteobacteria bacterium]